MKKLLRRINLIVAFASLLSLGLVSGVAHAAGTATYSLVQNGNSVSVYEDSASQAVNTVDAELAYGGSQPVSVSTAGSPFTNCTSSTSSSVVCFIPNTSVTGSQLVATLNFDAGASTQVNLSQSSMIVSQTPTADIWDHASGSGSFSFAAAPAPAPVHRAAPVATTPAPAPTPAPTPAVKADTTKKTPAKSVTVASAATKKTSYTADYIALVVFIVAAVAFEARRRMAMSGKEAALANSYKLSSAKKKSSATKSKAKKTRATAASKKASTSKAASNKKTSKK